MAVGTKGAWICPVGNVKSKEGEVVRVAGGIAHGVVVGNVLVTVFKLDGSRAIKRWILIIYSSTYSHSVQLFVVQ